MANQSGGSTCGGAPLSSSKQLRPIIEHLGVVKVNFVKCYDRRLLLKAAKEHNPELWIDLETPRAEFLEQNGVELHLGVSGDFQLEQQRNSTVKPHLDIYLPESEIPRLIDALNLAILRRPRP